MMVIKSRGEQGAESYLQRKKNGIKVTQNQIANEFDISNNVLRYYIKKKMDQNV